MTAFVISGSSVAIGDSSRAVTEADKPSIGPMASSCFTNSWEAKKITTSVASVCATTAQVAGEAALGWNFSGSSSSSSPSSSWPPRISRQK
ncbi:hypothetical protein ACFRQM_48760 [Streptomyces sp. NPDC056831]|uniref:hypothetical protein n=1 Tax=Streptomyces sp. NPDC056831 TaxID=3345954 RepID=UPI00367C5B72